MKNDINYKFVALINKHLDAGKAMNAIAHMSVGLVAMVNEDTREKMKFLNFVDRDGHEHPSTM